MYLGFSIAELLQFTEKERTIGISTYTLSHENGEEAVEALVLDPQLDRDAGRGASVVVVL